MLFSLKKAVSALALAAVAGCGAAVVTPYNVEPVSRGDAYQAQYRDITTPRDNRFLRSADMNAVPCLPYRGGIAGKTIAIERLLGEKFNRNDLLDVRIGTDEELSGSYVISRDGTLKIPFMQEIQAQGRSGPEVERALVEALEGSELYETAPPIST